MFNAASAGVLALQLDSLMVPVEVLSTPLQTLMVTVTAPTPGEATFAAAPTAVVHDADAVGVGVADLVGVGLAVGDWVGVPGWDGLAVPVISLDDLKTNKRAAGRHKDLADLDNLP